MIGIVYLKSNNQIIAIVPDVESHTDTDVVGKDDSVKGIDLTQAAYAVVSATKQKVGDLFDPVATVDIRNTTAYYRENRAREYPPIGDQLDALWKMITPPTGSEAEAMKAVINAVKTKYPKPVTKP